MMDKATIAKLDGILLSVSALSDSIRKTVEANEPDEYSCAIISAMAECVNTLVCEAIFTLPDCNENAPNAHAGKQEAQGA
jgi:hypothetical protein